MRYFDTVRGDLTFRFAAEVVATLILDIIVPVHPYNEICISYHAAKRP